MNLKVKDLSFSYTKKDTIKDINFEATNGDIVAILGVNGVGKSTLLKCLNKVHLPKSGEVYLDDKNVLNLKSKEIAKLIGYVSQDGNFIDGTVFENVLIGRKPFISWTLKDQDLEAVSNALKSVNLDELASRHIDKLSGGERQKVAICRVLAQKTNVLMLDEPTSNLDLKNQVECLNVIEKVTKEHNLITLISIHDINLALRYANKFLLLKGGTVYSFGDSSTINEESIKEVYGIDVTISNVEGKKIVIAR